MERSVNISPDAVENLDFCQEYRVIDTIRIVNTRLIASKCLYENMKRINIECNNEIFEEKIG